MKSPRSSGPTTGTFNSSSSKPTASANCGLLKFHQLPAWQQDNHYITTGYRPASNSFPLSLHSSIFALHNETVNVYTHLIGSVAALLLGTYIYQNRFLLAAAQVRYATATRTDIAVLSCFFAGAAGCLGMSATYHALSNHSQRVAALGNRLDYLGIVMLIWGSFVPTLYYGFKPEDLQLVWRYWGMISTFAVITGTTTLHPAFRTPALRPFRAAMFAAMGLSAVVPVLHGLVLYGHDALSPAMGLGWVVLQGVLYLVGAGIYAARVPERLAPGRFDIWGSSHQIFHVFVLLAAASHFVGLMKAFDYRHAADEAMFLKERYLQSAGF